MNIKIMNDKEFEDLIKESLKISEKPSQVSFSHMLSQLSEVPSDKKMMTPNTMINGVGEIINIWRSKRLVLIPSLVILLFISALTIYPRGTNASLQRLVAKDVLLEEQLYDSAWEYDDQTVLSDFDNDVIEELNQIQNDI